MTLLVLKGVRHLLEILARAVMNVHPPVREQDHTPQAAVVGHRIADCSCSSHARQFIAICVKGRRLRTSKGDT